VADAGRSAKKTPVTTSSKRSSECTSSKLAFTFACWGLLVPILFVVPAIVLGHIGRTIDRATQSKTKTAVVALGLAYFEAVLSGVLIYIYVSVPNGFSIYK